MLSNLLAFLSTTVVSAIDSWGMVGVFILMTLGSANIPIPSEIVMPFSGFLSSQGAFNYWIVIILGTLGDTTGALISYHAATKLDKKIRRKREFKSAENWFKKFGVWSVFIGRCIPVIRAFISFPAGMFKVNLWKFTLLTALGSFIWSWTLTHAGFVLGENWQTIEPYFKKFDFAIIGAFAVGLIWFIWHHRQGKNKAQI